MTRRPTSRGRDYTQFVTAEALFNEIAAVLADLPDDVSQVLKLATGIDDGIPRSYAAIARILGMPWSQVERLAGHGYMLLRHPDRVAGLRGYWDGVEDTERAALVLLRDRARQRSGIQAQTTFCDKHGYSQRASETACAYCPCPLPPHLIGRPRRFCTAACRQASYRARRG